MTEKKSQELSPVLRSPEEPRIIISSSYLRWSSRTHIWHPPTDIYETQTAVIVQVEIAGMHESEFIISLENRFFTISGIRQGPAEKGAYYQMEIPSGEFISLVELPSAVVYDKVEAIYKDGFLRVVLPEAIPSRIEVKK